MVIGQQLELLLAGLSRPQPTSVLTPEEVTLKGVQNFESALAIRGITCEVMTKKMNKLPQMAEEFDPDRLLHDFSL
jgi:hypothetical protein